MNEETLRLLNEVGAARTMEEVRAVVGRWRWEWCVQKDPELPAKLEQARREPGIPITLEELRIRLGL